MGSSLIVPIVLLVIILVFGVVFLININKQKTMGNNGKSNTENKIDNTKKSNNSKSSNVVQKEDIFKFMEFDKILDDMIVQNKGQKYTMILKCKGINYDLMSENEQLAVEEGFITFLNTLKFPVQLYVQAQNVDLKKTISRYNEQIQGLVSEYERANTEYNQVMNSLDSTKEEIKKADYNKKSVQNVLEYASDIVKYVERLSLNKSLLQRSFYVIFSYHTSEITSISNFSKDEIVNICYNELYTRAASISSALASCSVNTTLLKSNDLANLLYTSYNRDDAKYIDVEKALQSGFYRLYSTSDDAFSKRQALLDEQIKNEAQIKAYEALKKAIQDGEYVTPEMREIELNQEVAKTAIDIVRNEDFDEKIKDNAKDIIVEDYKKSKKKILEEASKKEQLAKENEAKKDKEEVIENKQDEEKQEIINKETLESSEKVKMQEEKVDEIIPKNEIKEESPIKEEIKQVEDKTETKENENLITNTTEENIDKKEKTENKEENTESNNTNNNSNGDFEDDFFDSII